MSYRSMSPEQQRWARVQELCEEIELSGDYSPAALRYKEPSEEIRREARKGAISARSIQKAGAREEKRKS